MEALSVEDAFSSLLLLCTVLELVLSSHLENAKEGGSNPKLEIHGDTTKSLFVTLLSSQGKIALPEKMLAALVGSA